MCLAFISNLLFLDDVKMPRPPDVVKLGPNTMLSHGKHDLLHIDTNVVQYCWDHCSIT